MKKLCVVGSLNIDLTVTLPRFHMPGESLIGTGFETFTGGKGGNQAIALARLGADVAIVGMVGADTNGALYRETFRREGVDASRVGVTTDAPTGVALIELDASTGDNRIAVVPGANMCIDDAFVDMQLPGMLHYDILLSQLEIPIDMVEVLCEAFHKAGKPVILDPAPAQPLSDRLVKSIDYITPNETELSILTGADVDDLAQVEAGARRLQARGVHTVIVKLGRRGAMLVTDKATLVPGFKVDTIDTTAAGDSFNAGFAFGLAQGMEVLDAVRLGNAAGALSTTSMGAQAAMCGYDEALALLQAQP